MSDDVYEDIAVDEETLRKDIRTVLDLIQPYDDVRATVGPVLAGFAEQRDGAEGNVLWIWSESESFPPTMFGPAPVDTLTDDILTFLDTLPGHPTI